MKGRKTGLYLAVAALLAVLLAMNAQTFALVFDQYNQYPDLGTDWSKFQIVTYSSGLTGFFDTETGKLYIYNSKVEDCVIIRQLVEPGKPLRKIK